jgi:hypothetical protein
MGSREEFLAAFSKVLDVELADIRDNYQLPATAVQWIEAVRFLDSFYYRIIREEI